VTGTEYVDRGTAIQLVCNATGRPDPPHNVNWYKVCHLVVMFHLVKKIGLKAYYHWLCVILKGQGVGVPHNMSVIGASHLKSQIKPSTRTRP